MRRIRGIAHITKYMFLLSVWRCVAFWVRLLLPSSLCACIVDVALVSAMDPPPILVDRVRVRHNIESEMKALAVRLLIYRLRSFTQQLQYLVLMP